ncbi:helix-turn-helix domain-containing protein [Veillonella criceti]|uniref:Helix-turn-helix domain n=1 Tax=Veillonella criceti TaxID=103891 RepID=A0A380Q0Y1_9FIRM|nr:helix-turn-helix transcriptional regulator [Veillonella criceti]SUP44354.1 Helix-turn-helix domain [Veillonella criceti]SUP79495.1 Helix-turn-helix domain [Veillonella criceti]
MIISTLKNILYERDLTAYRVATETNSSRTFIQNLISNKFQQLNVEYLNNLCKYLNLNFTDFLYYYPFNIDITLDNNIFKVIVNYDNDEFLEMSLYVTLLSENKIPVVNIKDSDFENWRSFYEDHENILLELTLESIEEIYRKKQNYNLEPFIFLTRVSLLTDVNL